MKIVYFDRNVFADICELRRGISQNEVSIITQAVKSNLIKIPVSYTLLEETLSILKIPEKDYELKYTRHIQTLLAVMDQKKMIKNWSELLTNACLSLITKTPFQGLEKLPENLSDILDLSKNREELVESAEEIINRYKNSANIILNSLSANPQLKQEMGIPETFKEFWKSASIDALEALCSQEHELIKKLCKEFGIKNMLNNKTLRIFTIYYSWLFYSGIYGVQGKPRDVKSGDMGDFFHAIQASVADIFVTQENNKPNKLPYVLGQISIKDFQIMNLDGFINFLSS